MSTSKVGQDQQPSAASVPCQLCYEESSSIVTVSNCKHKSCRACLTTWIQKEESSGPTAKPTCPFCRVLISKEDVIALLGRPFQPKKAVVEAGEVDELTLQWLNEHTKLCEGCGSRIEKVSGCNLIECLCGWRFCFGCGSPGGRCGCNRGHGFLNTAPVTDAPIRDDTGQVAMRYCIRRRAVRPTRLRLRGQQRFDEAARWKHSDKNAAVCTSNGRWLFSFVQDAKCIKMLAQQLRHELVQRERDRRKKQLKIAETARWAYSDKNASVCTSNGRWIFSSKNLNGSVRMLREQLTSERVQNNRRWRRVRQQRENRLTHNTNMLWLFRPQMSTSLEKRQLAESRSERIIGSGR
ncbi:hypothetical protein ACHAWF_006403 [Thalassiosira exigua]